MENRIAIGEINAFGHYVTDGQFMVATVRSSSALLQELLIKGQIVKRDGSLKQIEFSLRPPSDRSAVSNFSSLADGILQSIHVFPSPDFNVMRGQVYVDVQIRAGGPTGIIVHTLLAGYVEGMKPLTYPGSVIESPVSGAGFLHTLDLADVADAGACVYTVPDHARQRIRLVHFRYHVAAGLAAQNIELSVMDRLAVKQVLYSMPTATVQAVGTTEFYSYAWNILGNRLSSRTTFRATADNIENLPFDLTLSAGGKLTWLVGTSPQVGDLMDRIKIQIEEWIEPRTASDPP